MKGKIFTDTNILIYSFGKSDIKKKNRCVDIIDRYDRDSQLVWSTQVMQEFYFTMTRKKGKDPLRVKSLLSYFDNFDLVINNKEIIQKAIELQVILKLSFWDCLILSSAIASRCNYLLTEDLHDGQMVEGLTIVNPFNSNV